MTEPSTDPLAPDAPPIRTVRTVAEVRLAIAHLRSRGHPIALVPTMGALHDGHLSLIGLASDQGHEVVVSVFVNPTQFGPGEDLGAYPRHEARDVALAAEAGAALVFAPDPIEVYPGGFATTISVGGPSQGLEGAARPHHFDGVATVVAKLLLAVRPDRVVFGQKDAQQVAVVRRLMRDLHLHDIELVVGTTVREADGLAMSSRNAYLDPGRRTAATALVRGLRAAAALAAAGETEGSRLEQEAWDLMQSELGVEPEYAALVDPVTFERRAIAGAATIMCVAARVGPARLIDNMPCPRVSRGHMETHQETRPCAQETQLCVL